MSVTFDQLLDILTDNAAHEEGFKVQGDIHLFMSLIYEWKLDNLTNGQVANRINADLADPEYNTVKTHLDGLGGAATLGLERALMLGRAGDPLYDKAALRSRFGL